MAPDPWSDTAKFSVMSEPRIGTKLAVWTYQPYLSDRYAERWIVVGQRPVVPLFHGACEIYLEPVTAAYWKYPDHSTAAYFPIPDLPALVGVEFILQAIVRDGARTDLSSGIAVRIQ